MTRARRYRPSDFDRGRVIIAMTCLLMAGCGTQPEPASPSPTASPPARSEGISREEALSVARDAVSEMADEWRESEVSAGPLEQVVPEFESYEWARELPTDLRVWRVGLVSGDLSALVVTDFMDGRVYGVVVGIAD